MRNNSDLIYAHTKVGTAARLNRPSGRRRVFYLNNDRADLDRSQKQRRCVGEGQDIDPQMDADAAVTLLLGCANPDEGQKESPIRAKSIEKKTLVATGFLIDRSPLRIASFAASAWSRESSNHRHSCSWKVDRRNGPGPRLRLHAGAN